MKYDAKYDDYVMAAISMEGSKGWPSQWPRDCDESFQKYKAAVDKGERVSAEPFLAAQKLVFAKMADPDRCEPKQTRNVRSNPRQLSRVRSYKKNRRSRRRRHRRRY
jgi:hypothetical protein